MERSLKQTSNSKYQRSNAPKSSEKAGGCNDIASAAYDEYLWLLQKRNRLLKRLKTKDEQQVELEKREQGFSVYINGANREFQNFPTSRRTKTADEHFSSRKLLSSAFQLNEETKETSRAKTAPTKLTRKEWKPVGFKIKTEQGDRINVNVPGKITGIYSEDFDEIEYDHSESEAPDSNEDSSSDHDVEELSLSFNDVHKLRRSLEKDSKIQESIQTVIECDSFVESDEDKGGTDDDKSPVELLDTGDIEDKREHESEEEIEEDIEVIDTSVDVRDSTVLENIPQLRSSYVIYEDKTDETLRSKRPVINQSKAEEDTIVLSFSKSKPTKRLLSATRRSAEVVEDRKESQDKKPQHEQATSNRLSSPKMKEYERKTQISARTDMSDLKSSGFRGPRPLSTTSRKKQESSFTLSSQDVLDAMTLENDQVELSQKHSDVVETKEDLLKNISEIDQPITDQTVAMVTKKVRNMNPSQQKQLLDLLAKLDPTVSQSISVPPKVQPSIAFGSPISSPTQPLSPRENFGETEAELSANKSKSLAVNFEIKSNWGHPSEIGLTEVQFFDSGGLLIDVPKHQISLSSKNANEIPLSNLVNGKTKTTNEKYMWKCPYTSGDIITLSFQIPCPWTAGEHNLSKIKVWNYNKKMKDLSIGVKEVKILTSGSLVWEGIIDKGCGNQIYDYAEVIHLKSKEKSECTDDVEKQDFDGINEDELATFQRNEDEPLSPDIIVESSDLTSYGHRGPKPILHSDSEIAKSQPDDNFQILKGEHFSITETEKLPRKPPWLDEIKEKRSSSSHSPFIYVKTNANWLDNTDCDKKKDSELLLAENPGLLDQPKARSRPSSGRRSSRNPTPDSSKRTTLRPESGRRSVEQPQESLELHEQLTKLCTGHDVSPEDNPVEQERWLEESLNSLSQFKRCHQGRITPSNRIEMDRQGDALDNLLRPDRQMHGEQECDSDNLSFDDDFIIPELPSGQRLVINILSTWGDHYYVGLNGIEVFNSAGKPVQISKITADPSDINILSEYNKDPRVVSNLIDGVYVTRDDMHLWLAPFTEGKGHFIYVDFKEVSTLAMIRIWNYNKSRIHSFRGAKDIEIFLNDHLIFRGEMARASGELGSSETFGDTILFTMNEEILEAMAANDETYEADVDEDEDFLQSSNNFKRPVTADTGIETEALERPYTCPKERKKPTVEGTFPNKVLEEDFSDDTDGYSENYFGKVLELNLVATWGDVYYLGLTGLQLLGGQGQVIDLTLDMLQASPKDLNDLPDYDDDDRTLDKLIDGVNVTMSDEHMWLIPFTPSENHLLTVTLKQSLEITGLRVWNYNKSPESTSRGVKRIIVKLDGKIVGSKEGILIRKGPGHCHFDFGQDITFLNPPRKPEVKQHDKGAGECELTVKPCGFVFQFQLFGSWGDPYYLGLNGLQFFDEHGGMIELSQKNVTAYPESVNVLEGVKDDVRTPAKLIDGINDTDDGRHMWLAPVFPGLINLLYVIFDEPTTISMIKLWNYRKTPIRGVRQFSILVDDLLIFNGILPQVPTVSRGILPNMDMPVPHAAILFTDDETIRRKEKSYVINGGGFFESQEVRLMNDKTDFQQGKKSSQDPDQAMRPKTSVTHLARTRR